MVQTKHDYCSSKTLIKRLEILQITLITPQNVIIQVLRFWTHLSNAVKWAPEGSRGVPEGPAGGPPIIPTIIQINVNEFKII